MTGLLAAEWIKLSKRKLLWVLGGIGLALTVFGAFFTFAAADFLESADLAVLTPPQKPEAFLVGLSQAAGNSWIPVVIATVMLGSEFSKNTWPVVLTWDSRRLAQLLSRVVVLTGGALAISLVTVVAWSLFAAAYADGSGSPSLVEWLLGLGKLGLTQVVWVAIGLSAAALLRATGLAVGLALAFTFVEQVISLWRPYQQIGIQTSSTGLFGIDLGGLTGGLVDYPDPAQAALVLIGWTVLALGVAWASLALRDA